MQHVNGHEILNSLTLIVGPARTVLRHVGRVMIGVVEVRNSYSAVGHAVPFCGLQNRGVVSLLTVN